MASRESRNRDFLWAGTGNHKKRFHLLRHVKVSSQQQT